MIHDPTLDTSWLRSPEPETLLASDPTAEEISDYIVDMLQELRDLARSSGQGSLSVLLELAERQARHDAAKPRTSRQGGS